MWTVTTTGDLHRDRGERRYEAALAAWTDYHGRILAFEINGFARDAEEGPFSTGGAGFAI